MAALSVQVRAWLKLFTSKTLLPRNSRAISMAWMQPNAGDLLESVGPLEAPSCDKSNDSIMVGSCSSIGTLEKQICETAFTPTKPSRQYSRRGTQGTFGGRRPPKTQEKLAAFDEAKLANEAMLAAKKENKKVLDPPGYYPNKAVKKGLPENGNSRYRNFLRDKIRERRAKSPTKPQRTVFKECIEEWNRRKPS